MKQSSILVLLAAVGASGPAMAGHGKGLEACLSSAREVKKGAVIKVEYLSLTDEGSPAYELEIRDARGLTWELECSATSGAIIEIEREVASANDKLFSQSAKVDESAARATAVALYPGKVVEVEFEVEADGEPVYEFDIRDGDGAEMKVEVSAATGKVVEVQVETWQIGEE